MQRSKFYFFDNGVNRALAQTLNVELLSATGDFGRAFEHFIVLEVHKLNLYSKKDFRLSYIRTKDNVEIHLVIKIPKNKVYLIEIKSSSRVDTATMAGKMALLS